MATLISVIVPVYNTEAYLRESVRSVLTQTYPHLEVLLIDDGSQDGSGAVCEALSGEDARVRFLPRPHGGVSAARNAGLDAARGEYLFFLDSDDRIDPRLLESMLVLCENAGAALATVEYQYIETLEPLESPDLLSPPPEPFESYVYMDNAEALRRFSSEELAASFQAIGGKLVRRNALGPIRFDETLSNGEDTMFLYQLLASGLDAVLLTETWYYYHKRPQGGSERLTVQSCEDVYRFLGDIFARETRRGGDSQAACWARTISTRLRRLYQRSRQTGNREAAACLRSLGRQEIHTRRFRLLSPVEKCKHYLAFFSYPLYVPANQLWTRRWQRQEEKRKLAERISNERI